ncbi:DNA-binding protein [Cellvibrio japonicus]|uniref:TnpT protein n=1 Tax=Cellvibrio japonicus (strain Ueda107) TaxID=498211 RepID=B3PFV7_CELJU|nr:DNA-binding protein [Cellvibrio japonicus]ACE86185.1 TnpT protein [Cellvibrio japonicus Ueda107]QEI12322.1 integrase [Cellvibrio japonicus]QEI15895.1 integrase [Cellvibrio japonicus]QEI19474.1 integrase [Cellvibrio japonicus]
MANSGITKFQVQQARDSLLAKGQHPSIDAVRVALGNTGSKATIHRYLKELNEESASRLGKKAATSDAINHLVESLASQLQQEAQQVVDDYQARHTITYNELKSRIDQQAQQLMVATATIDQIQSQLSDSQQAYNALTLDHQALRIEAERLKQQLADKDIQLNDKEVHLRNLEEKYQHARDNLEHFRSSVKDQRDQEQRRHEHQIQQLQGELRLLNQTLSLKQTDITQLNKDNAQLTTQLADTRRELQQVEQRRQASERTAQETLTAMALLEQDNQRRKSTIEDLNRIVDELEAKLSDTTSSLVSVRTELTVKNQLFETLGQSLRPQ